MLNTKISRLAIVLIVISLMVPAWHVWAQTTPAQVQITQIDSAGSRYPQVSLMVGVLDNTGQPVSGLTATDFSVSENQAPVANLQVQAVKVPVAIGFVIDSSKNFERNEGGLPLVEQAKRVVDDWIMSPEAVQDGDMLALYAFKDGLPTELQAFKINNRNDLHNDLLPDLPVPVVSTRGNVQTALFDIVRTSINAASAQLVARRMLVIFSDGIDKTSSFDVDAIIKQAKDANLIIYTIGMRSDLKLAPDQEGSRFLRRLAQETGGEYIWYRPANKDARPQLNEFLARMSNQRNLYQITYDTAQCSGDPGVRIVLSGTSVETSAIYKIPQHTPTISLEGLVKDREYLGTSETLKVGVVCSQSPLTKVEFKVNGQVEYTANAEPFEYTWDTDASAKSLGFAPNEIHPVKVTAVAYAGAYTAEASQSVYIQQKQPVQQVMLDNNGTPVPLPCTTGNSFENFVCELQRGNIIAYVTVAGFIMALLAVVLLVVLIRRGGVRAVGQFVAEGARRVTKTFQRKTGIKGPGGVVVRPAGFATLILESEPYAGKRIYMEEANAYIGRVPEKADIVFDWDDYISGRHAKLKCEQGRFFVWDMQSANGTWVNDQRVPKSMSDGVDYNEAREVFDGSIIRLGPDLRLRFKSGTEQDVSAPMSPMVPAESMASIPSPATGAGSYRPGSTNVMHVSRDDTLTAPAANQQNE